MSFYLSAIILGLGFSLLALGIFLSLRVFNFPDITTDGSFTLGGAVTAVMLVNGYNPLSAFVAAMISGAAAGMCTGFIHTKMKVNPLLSGILMMTALYSVNLAVMGRSNIPLIEQQKIFDVIHLNEFASMLLFAVVFWVLLSLLLKTDFGLAMRATGNNEQMIRALGVNTDRMKIAGLAISNSLTALSGYLIVQYQGFADINMGIGIVILGLGSVMIGEIFVRPSVTNIFLRLAAIIIGSILFRLVLAVALASGVDAGYLKLVVALIVLAVVGIPNLKLIRGK
ncbi:MAG TPA: ABC transporter permease [Bacteroidia bacterium]|nr:ABC transporter permease [Bacteroidia bacterium]